MFCSPEIVVVTQGKAKVSNDGQLCCCILPLVNYGSNITIFGQSCERAIHTIISPVGKKNGI